MENMGPTGPQTEKSVTPEDKILAFEDAKTPEELSALMAKNIHYGFVGKNNKKIYSPDDPKMPADFSKEYFLQSPAELIESGHGICWDSTELERDWFTKHGYNFKVFFMMFAKDTPNNLPTHTFLAFENQGKWCWFEHAFGAQRGIHEYTSLEELIVDVKMKHSNYAMEQAGASAEDFQKIRTCEYKQATYGSSAREFMAETATNITPLKRARKI